MKLKIANQAAWEGIHRISFSLPQMRLVYLPPIAQLTIDQAMYYFLSGYTAKVAGTEKGVKEPVATFSACFGSPFMVHHPMVYANFLGEKMKKTGATCWLVNTGWTGGPYGVGSRIKINYTRAMVAAILDNRLDNVELCI